MPDETTPTPVAPTVALEEARPDPLASSVAAAVTKLRRDAGLSERAAAKKLGTSQTQLRRMEDPRYLPSLRSLQRVANAYGAQLKVSFESTSPEPEKKDAAPKPAAPARPAKTAARASASPSKARRAAPRRGRAAARPPQRRAAPRRRAR
ncbi:MAG TPA: helix-turn-helix transcriptional regulator [Candidatus Limnocylindria bacterium]